MRRGPKTAGVIQSLPVAEVCMLPVITGPCKQVLSQMTQIRRPKPAAGAKTA
jgi:hypothetical protein